MRKSSSAASQDGMTLAVVAHAEENPTLVYK